MNIFLSNKQTLQKVTLCDGATAYDAAAALEQQRTVVSIAAKVNGIAVDLSTVLHDGDTVEILTFEHPEGRKIFWHSSSHILAQAVQELFPEAKIAIGPAIEQGFYYDFDIEQAFTADDLAAIEKRCSEIAARNLPLERIVLSPEDTRRYFSEKNEPYKLELLNEIDGQPCLYRQGAWQDLCRGPHIPNTGIVKAFKVLSVAGAYWRGSEKNKMLQRIYGISFPSQAMLDEHLAILAEAQRRDHRTVGRELDLYSICEAIGSGLVLWHPKGGRLRSIIEDFWRREHFRNGYEIVYSPHIGRANLWETSGHLNFYRENMYAPMSIDEEEYFVKPMNCPFHIMMYKSMVRSYRDLPLRWAELGTVYRYEKSGVLHGLLRVRGFTQDDAHLFCRPDQMPEEIHRVLQFCLNMLKAFGFERFKVYLATRPANGAVGEAADWENATAALHGAVKEAGLEFEIDEGGGAFYGPKIDIKIRDALNREWQCSTIQFDFNMPSRFDLSYTASDNTRQRPYMIHRALLGSMERFMGILIEHYAGALPVWLSPVQVRIIPVADAFVVYGQTVLEALVRAGIRAEIDNRQEKMGYKIRSAEMLKIPYMAIVGEREERARAVAVRRHGKGDQGAMTVDDFITRIFAENQVPRSESAQRFS